jgi:hypothetical protein
MNMERKQNIRSVTINDIKRKFKRKIMDNTYEILIPDHQQNEKINLTCDMRNERRGNL